MGLRSHLNPDLIKQTDFLIDTYCTIMIPDQPKANQAMEKAFVRMKEIDTKASVGSTTNQIFNFNFNNQPITDPELVYMVTASIYYSELSGGDFDITVYPLVKLWGFYSAENQHVPSSQDIQHALLLVNYKQLVLSGNSILKTRSEVKVDLGGIAKGYAVGEAAKVICNSGIKDFLIDAGGQIYAQGKFRHRNWKIGIRHPRDAKKMMGTLFIDKVSTATSGDYQRFFVQNGKRYCHILDPHTGYPAQGIMGITVIHSHPMVADILSTVLFVSGEKKAVARAEKTPKISMILMTNQLKIIKSTQFAKLEK